MDKKKIIPRKKRYVISVYMDAREHEQFHNGFVASSEIAISNYARRFLLGQPVTTFYRDIAFDEFTEAAILFRKDASLIMQHPSWTEAVKTKLEVMLEEMYQLHLKIHEHVRKNNIKQKRSSHTDV